MPELVLGDSLEALIDHRGKTPKKLGGDFTRYGVPVASAMLVQDQRLRLDKARFVAPEMFRRWMPIPTKRHDVLLTSEAPLGRVALVPDDQPLVLGQRIFGLRGKPGILDSQFLYYALQTDSVQGRLHGRATGTTVSGIRQSELVKVRIPAPSFPQQQAIAAALGALDDKIAVNDQIARSCNDLALAHGHQALRESVGDENPLEDCADVTKGASYRSADLSRGKDGLVSLKCVGRNGDFQPSGIKQYGGECKSTQIIQEGDIVVAQTDLTQQAEVIGRPIRVVDFHKRGRMVASLDLAIVRPRYPLSREILYALLTTQAFRDHAMSYCNGTTVLHLGSRSIPEFRFVRPSAETVSRATEIMAPLLSRSDQARRENQALTGLRDALLPRLMSGEIRVRDAEKLVEDAT